MGHGVLMYVLTLTCYKKSRGDLSHEPQAPLRRRLISAAYEVGRRRLVASSLGGA